MVEVANSVEWGYGYALIGGTKASAGLLRAAEHRESVNAPYTLRLLSESNSWARLKGANEDSEHRACIFLTLVSGRHARQIAIYGEVPAGPVERVWNELEKIVEYERRPAIRE